MQRLIEAERVSNSLNLFLRNRCIPKEDLGGIAGHEVEHEEHDDEYPKYDDD